MLVLAGDVAVIVDDDVHPLPPGHVAALPPGARVHHTAVNRGETEARLVIVSVTPEGDEVFYR